MNIPTEQSIQALLDCASAQLTAVSDSAQLDAEVLLCHCLEKSRAFLRTWPERQITPAQFHQFEALLAKRMQGMPIAYLTGEREFWSRTFRVTPDVLIPRPDSELLIELSLPLMRDAERGKMIDLGTGSGILAITLATEMPFLDVVATDISLAALAVAKENATRLNTKNARFLASHWFESVPDTDFDLVISNPPYIAGDDPHLQQGDVRFEPQTALISDDQGLQDIRILADQARQHLKIGGHLLLEHGYQQANAVQAILNDLKYSQVATHCDLSGNPRVTSGLWNPT